jgi:hypothetical protein
MIVCLGIGIGLNDGFLFSFLEKLIEMLVAVSILLKESVKFLIVFKRCPIFLLINLNTHYLYNKTQ